MALDDQVRLIAKTYFEQKPPEEKRSLNQVSAHMLDWAYKGWLSPKFIDGCTSAILAGKSVVIHYSPGKHYGYLTEATQAH